MNKIDNKSIVLKKVQTGQFLVLFSCMKLVFSKVIKLNQDKACLCVCMCLHLSMWGCLCMCVYIHISRENMLYALINLNIYA